MSTSAIQFHIDESQCQPGTPSWKLRQKFLRQARTASSEMPDLRGLCPAVRDIRLGKRGSRSGYFASRKNAVGNLPAVLIAIESRLELAFAATLERDRNVVAYRNQAIELQFPDGRKLYPDFLILDRNGRLRVTEVKFDRNWLSERARENLDHIGEMLGRWGVEFSIVDQHGLPNRTELDTLLWLYHQIQGQPSDEECERLVAAMQAEGIASDTFFNLRERCWGFGLPEDIVAYALFIGVLKTDWSRPGSWTMEVSL